MRLLALLLLSWILTTGQGLFTQLQTTPYNPKNNEAVVKTISDQSSAVVMIRGFGMSPSRMRLWRSGDSIVQSTEGTGFIIDSSGTILTNKHVVDNSGETYSVITSNGLRYSVVSINRDPSNDVAVVKINPNEHQGEALKALSLGDSDNIQVGEQVVAMGDDPGNTSPTILSGFIIGRGDTIVAEDYQSSNSEKLSNVIETDLGLVPGNSGSPLLNQSGKVIGINTAISGGLETMSFAIPINAVKDFVKNNQ
ncbi:trypsin-like peptidase domain-containing protein [Patescibacteria group bacterium]|nr:trypsin-like peptidase domain-containing protein [Patescibacteria group bacterium]